MTVVVKPKRNRANVARGLIPAPKTDRMDRTEGGQISNVLTRMAVGDSLNMEGGRILTKTTTEIQTQTIEEIKFKFNLETTTNHRNSHTAP